MKLNIAILPGDGIGPEVTAQAVKAIEAVCGRFGHSLLAECGQIGACAIDSCGDPFPDSTQRLCGISAKTFRLCRMPTASHSNRLI